MTVFHGRFPEFVITALPTSKATILSLSFWIILPPFLKVAAPSHPP
ncbi:MAG TPA: hypothetical protein VH481_09175 [Nitrososphaeraceae archaeon]